MIPKIRTILYATDLNEHAPFVFRYAVSLAQRYDAEIVLLHALEPLSTTGESLIRNVLPQKELEALREEGMKQVRAQIHERLERFCTEELGKEPAKIGEIARVQVLHGPPARTILEQARSHQADLIVMGTHGHSGVARVFLGSVANKVVQQSEIPVLVVPSAGSRDA